MGFFSKLREGLRSIREKLSSIGRRKDVPPDARKDIKAVKKKVEALEREAKPQERLETERFKPRHGPRTYRVQLQLRSVSSTRKYPDYDERIVADSPEEAIAIAENDWVERHGEIDYVLSESAKHEKDADE